MGQRIGNWERAKLIPGYDALGLTGFTPPSSITPATNGQAAFEFPANQQLNFKSKGSDGVVRDHLTAYYSADKLNVCMGSYNDPVFNLTAGQGANNLVAIGMEMFGTGTPGTHRITDSVVIGSRSCQSLLNGNGNVTIGNLTLTQQTSGDHQTLIGDSCGRFITTGGGNTIVGYVAGGNLVTSAQNTIMGWFAGGYIETGSYNVLIGAYSGAHSEIAGTNIGDYNLGMGYGSLQFCQGAYNVALGKEALYNVTGNHNIGIGDQTGLTVVAGSNNIFIGQDAGNSTGVQKINAQNTICIGKDTFSTVDNSVMIGDINITKTTLRGDLNGIGSIDFTVDLAGSLPTNGALSRWATYMVLNVPAGGLLVANSDNSTWLARIAADGRFETRPPASATPTDNGNMTFQLTSNTSLEIKVKGSDGTVRSVALTLS